MADEIIFDRELIQYLPTILRDVQEFQAIMSAEQPEIVELWHQTDRAMQNQFIDSSDEYGVKRWENILQIRPPATDTLIRRKERILLLLRMKLPYTLRWLRQWLDANCGTGNYSLEIVKYTVHILLLYDHLADGHDIFVDVLDLLRWVLPANMLIEIFGERAQYFFLMHKGFTESRVEIEIGEAPISTTSLFCRHSFTESRTTIEIYPQEVF